ncbi:unnamed protein product [Brachionus calyciflorus]|uniref:Uncharacterized protein n=1 Tax=Brachionus calyciflorus TaxID=104777 RepID=A0A813QDP4_9BILA|nr:unnamed protein product [Brachionus calyciflorus]
MSDLLKIGTHNGQFHCDEVLACYMLRQLPTYKNSPIVRTRDPAELDKCDIVVDVGGVYDASKNRFDHHQRSFTETFSTIDPTRPWNIKLSSAGLIYVHFGKQIIEQILLKHSIIDEKLVDVLYDKMYEQFVREIDAIDNGVEIAENKKYDITTNLSSRVSYFNPAWNQENLDENIQFNLALDYVGKEFEDKIKYYALVWWPARTYVEKAINERFNLDDSGAIIRLEIPVPWKSHLFALEKDLNIPDSEIKYVISLDRVSQTYRIICVPINENSFINRLSLPSEWCGLRDEELSTKSAIQGCIFVHANGFIGGNKTFEGALEMLQKSLELNNIKKRKL